MQCPEHLMGPSWGSSNKQQMYDIFWGISLNHSVLCVYCFGLDSYNDPCLPQLCEVKLCYFFFCHHFYPERKHTD